MTSSDTFGDQRKAGSDGGRIGPDDVVVALSTAPDLLLAKRIAHVLVEERLAACVNLGAACVSMYMWEGKLEGGEEIPLTIKTTGQQLDALQRRLVALHPYDVPEFLVLPVLGGLPAYLDWVRAVRDGDET